MNKLVHVTFCRCAGVKQAAPSFRQQRNKCGESFRKSPGKSVGHRVLASVSGLGSWCLQETIMACSMSRGEFPVSEERGDA